MKTMLEGEVLSRYQNVIGIPRGSERGLLRDRHPLCAVQAVSGEVGYLFENEPNLAFVVLDTPFGTIIPKESVAMSFNRVASNISMYDKALREDVIDKFLSYCFSEHIPALSA